MLTITNSDVKQSLVESFDPIQYVDNMWVNLPVMKRYQSQKLREVIKNNDFKYTLELGFHHGKSSAYTAAILKSLGRGHHTAIDLYSAKYRQPNIDTVMRKLDLDDWCTWYYEQYSYTWRLMKFIEEYGGHHFDFCYIDGGHLWDITGYGFFLVDILLKPGGMIIFDDIEWTIEKNSDQHPKFIDETFSKEFISTPQVGKVFDLLVRPHPSYVCETWKGWGIATKSLV